MFIAVYVTVVYESLSVVVGLLRQLLERVDHKSSLKYPMAIIDEIQELREILHHLWAMAWPALLKRRLVGRV